MKNPFALAAVSVFLAVQLVLLTTRSNVISYNGPDYPAIELPEAKEGARNCCRSPVLNLSWTPRGGWVALGKGSVALQPAIRDWVHFCDERQVIPVLRLRIPGDAPARQFTDAASAAEREGVHRIRVAVHLPTPG